MKVRLLTVCLCLCSFFSLARADLNDGLVAYYPFNGNAEDASGYGHHGVVYGAQLTANERGVENSAYEFDGINDYIDFGSALPDMELMTASLWVFVPARDRIACIFADTDDLSLKMDEVDEIKIVGKKGGGQLEHGFKLYESLESRTPFSIGNRWVHMVWVMTQSQSTIYIDGVARGRYFKGGSNVGAHDLQVGCAYWRRGGQISQDYCWQGKISSMRFYNRILDDSEITALYDGTRDSGGVDDGPSDNSAPTVMGVYASQRSDGSGMVDITYTLSDLDGDACLVSLEVSDDGGSTWSIIPSPEALSGDVGDSILPGTRHMTWASQIDLPGVHGLQYRVRVTADDGYVESPIADEMVFVSIDDPGVSGHEGFNGDMSKCETTNGQYCQYLNAALADGLILVSGDVVYAAGDTAKEEPYFLTQAASSSSQILYTGYTFSVSERDGLSMDNHPVVRVSWYGAQAFCDYYGYRLPTEWEWRAVADYDGSYTYGCGTDIDLSKANYKSDNPLGLTGYPYTTPVGHYPSYGYGLGDMAGNVLEWTSSSSGSSRVICGGSWYSGASDCAVSRRPAGAPKNTYSHTGFRVCLDAPTNRISHTFEFVSIQDPGLAGHEGFSLEMSKYETTHGQYCQYLNDALADGSLIIRSNGVVYAASDTSYSIPYYYTHEAYADSQISYANGVFSVRTRDGHDMSNHPVARVTGYGATAFAAYYGWRLPTKWEWQAVADYDGSYQYGCGQTIDSSKLNYDWNNPLGLTDSPYTTPVGRYPAYGYGLCDMAGNVWEWTSTVEGPHRAFCGGSWCYDQSYCQISNFGLDPPDGTRDNIGFRVCR